MKKIKVEPQPRKRFRTFHAFTKRDAQLTGRLAEGPPFDSQADAMTYWMGRQLRKGVYIVIIDTGETGRGWKKVGEWEVEEVVK